ncbi:alkaline phosphatase family protein [Natronomonas marina]|jgi:predicted AlkP superfamily phosphohydrolase/phosphomutase|uniref:alkaline phosphatase family protein n=1 Tax=Natronomonas marina TaxID=2961939 RepID=UPI0020C9A3B4|nr:alkaline phosphatase family protein [Natronomonas marina]
MTLVVLGIDALDPDLVDPDAHPNLTLAAHRAIDTIVSSSGEPSTHELWPTIITGLPPAEHGLELDDGVAWENPLLAALSSVADYAVPDGLQTRLGAWLLTNTDADAFRVPATYYAEEGIETVFDGREATAIGVPNYVVDPDTEDREHQLRRQMGELFERDPGATGGHRSADPVAFYEQCLEMAMIRIARTRRALRSREYELVFGYTSGLDLIGHVSHSRPELQAGAYDELDEFVGELRGDLGDDDELLLVSDHGLQDGLHTEEAMVAGTDPGTVERIESVLDVSDAVDAALADGAHVPEPRWDDDEGAGDSEAVREQLEDLGYM